MADVGGEPVRAERPAVPVDGMSSELPRRAVAVPPPVADVRRSVLPGGIRVLTDTVPGASSATVSVWVGVGGRDEPEATAGASHFLEHLLFKGTDRLSARELALQVDAAGGEMNAYTASEYTSYYLRVPATELEVAVELLLDVVAAPALRPEEFASEREVILEELAAAEDDPEDLVSVRLFEALFPGHALGREVLGSVGSISALTRDEVAAFFSQWYRGTNLVVTGAGAVDHDRLVQTVAEHLDGTAGAPRPERSAPPPAADTVVAAHDPGDLVQLAWGWRSGGATDEDRYALAVLNHILGAGPSSRLFQQVREEHGLTYSISSGVSQYSDAGVLSVGCATSPSKARRVAELVRGEVAQLAGSGITAAELSRAQRSMRGALLLGLEDTSTRGARLGVSELLRGGVTALPEHLERLESVTLDQVAGVAASVLGGACVCSLVGPGELDAIVA